LQVPALSWLGLDTPELVAHAHAVGVAVHYFTIDEERRMRQLVRAGADGIMTNRPDRLRRVLAEHRSP
jgi:glycerophosphoryl diester phosphodiesterase